MGIGEIFYEMWDGILDGVYQIKTYQNQDKGFKVLVKIIHENHTIETQSGLLSDDNSFLYMPHMKRLFFNPKIYYEKGSKIAFIPYMSHGDIKFDKLCKVSEAQKTDIMLKWQHGRKWITTEIIKCQSTIDWNLFDNDFSPRFSHLCFDLVNTKILTFLQDMSNVKFLMSLVISGLVGFISGAMLMLMVRG